LNRISDTNTMPGIVCAICGNSETILIGNKAGTYSQKSFEIRHCKDCGFSFVANPITDLKILYDDDYYSGKGADPLVDYIYELENPDKTIRFYEWTGIHQVVKNLTGINKETMWLDFGCGNGGLVRFVSQREPCTILGFEEASIRNTSLALGIPVVDDEYLESMQNNFDIVTAIEVLEHLTDPIQVLKRIRTLMKPGGLLFFTTGNAQPVAEKILHWRYVLPEVHISFFEPRTLELALKLAGFQPEYRGFVPGFENIIRFKILKALRSRRRFFGERWLPWRLLTRLTDTRLKITDHPIGWAK
jgi:SAM-dependent methyltransferase